MQVIILAAGKGTRMEGLKKGQSKCSLYVEDEKVTPIIRLIKQVVKIRDRQSVDFFIVLGYGGSEIARQVTDFAYNNFINVNFIYNPHYGDFGCNYSLACAGSVIKRDDSVVILEGDSVYSDQVVRDFIFSQNDETSCSCLTRDSGYISKKSVCTIVNKKSRKVVKYKYDINHAANFSTIFNDADLTVQDNMQIWFIGKNYTSYLISGLSNYRQEVLSPNCCSEKTRTASGVYTLNELIQSRQLPIMSVKSTDPERWYNLNTKEDIEQVRSLIKEGQL